jgi:hypothetical protein
MLEKVITAYRALIQAEKGEDFPQDVQEQLRLAVNAVFRSWNNPRAITYRRLNHIPDDLGTAVNVQLMVFGNIGEKSGTGVGFTRNPATGDKMLYGEYLLNAQGEDVGPACELPPRSASSSPRCPVSTRNSRTSPRTSRNITAMSRTRVHHPGRQALTCSRRETASGPARPRSGSPSTWSKKD